MSEISVSFSSEMSEEVRHAIFGAPQWWTHLRASVSEGCCPRCSGRMEPLPEHEARVAGYCATCDRTWWIGGTDTEYAESGEAVGRR